MTRRPSLAVVHGDPDQVLRRDALERAHPHVSIAYDYVYGYWSALIAEDGGEKTVVRYDLGELLDRVEQVLTAP